MEAGAQQERHTNIVVKTGQNKWERQVDIPALLASLPSTYVLPSAASPYLALLELFRLHPLLSHERAVRSAMDLDRQIVKYEEIAAKEDDDDDDDEEEQPNQDLIDFNEGLE